MIAEAKLQEKAWSPLLPVRTSHQTLGLAPTAISHPALFSMQVPLACHFVHMTSKLCYLLLSAACNKTHYKARQYISILPILRMLIEGLLTDDLHDLLTVKQQESIARMLHCLLPRLGRAFCVAAAEAAASGLAGLPEVAAPAVLQLRSRSDTGRSSSGGGSSMLGAGFADDPARDSCKDVRFDPWLSRSPCDMKIALSKSLSDSLRHFHN